ncbi:MAG: MSHA biogenesis protein MshK [Burkholderiaceae bacterium]
MAKPVSSSFILKTIQGLFLMLMVVNLAYAEQFADPTRPPDTMGSGQTANPNVESAPVLQSVLISPHRRLAIINGKAVKLGEKFGKSKLVSITETEVVLQSGKDLQTLKLFPGVQKRLTSEAVDNRADRRR